MLLLPLCALAGSAGRGASATPDAAEIVAQIQALTKGHQYHGQTYSAEFVRNVGFEPASGSLVFEIDDAEETAPVAVIIPLREAEVDPTLGKFRGDGSPAIIFSCKPPCITTTYDGLAEAMQKLSAGSAADLNHAKRASLFALGCHADRCAAIQGAIADLVGMAANARSAPQRSDPGPILARINALTAALDSIEPAKSDADKKRGTQVISTRYDTTLDAGKVALSITFRVEWLGRQASRASAPVDSRFTFVRSRGIDSFIFGSVFLWPPPGSPGRG